VKGVRRRLGDGAVEPGGDPAPQLVRGLAAEGEDEDVLGRRALRHPFDDRFDHRGRFSGARSGEHEQWAGGVRHDGLLLLVEHRHPHRLDRWPDQPVGGCGVTHPHIQPAGSDGSAYLASSTFAIMTLVTGSSRDHDVAASLPS
jgi:hypothetical protein